MNLSKREYRRAKPLMGTTVAIDVVSPLSDQAVYESIAASFQYVEALQNDLNFHKTGNALAQFNSAQPGESVKVSAAVFEIFRLSLDLWQMSEGAFCPTIEPSRCVPFEGWMEGSSSYIKKTSNCVFDLGGIAKGFVVDHAVFQLTQSLPDVEGTINAGGDLRIFGENRKDCTLRLGPLEAPLQRNLTMPRSSVATSAFGASSLNAQSSTHHRGVFQRRLPERWTVVASAESCAVADALTKVAIYGRAEVVEICAKKFAAVIMVFDEHGELFECFGDP